MAASMYIYISGTALTSDFNLVICNWWIYIHTALAMPYNYVHIYTTILYIASYLYAHMKI